MFYIMMLKYITLSARNVLKIHRSAFYGTPGISSVHLFGLILIVNVIFCTLSHKWIIRSEGTCIFRRIKSTIEQKGQFDIADNR